MTECQHLRDEIGRLRQILIDNDIDPDPVAPKRAVPIPSNLSSVSLTTRQKIEERNDLGSGGCVTSLDGKVRRAGCALHGLEKRVRAGANCGFRAMAITIPNSRRSPFRSDVDHDSGLMAIGF